MNKEKELYYRAHVLLLEKRRTMGVRRGIVWMIIGLIIMFLGFIIFPSPTKEAIFLLILGLCIIYLGVLFLFIIGDTARNLIQAAQLIYSLDPEELVITTRYVMGRKGNIYLFAKWTNYMLYLIRFRDISVVSDKKIQLLSPKTIFSPHKYIEKRKVYYSHGKIRIPISSSQFGEGTGILYSIERQKIKPFGILGGRVTDVPLDSEMILEILEELKRENFE